MRLSMRQAGPARTGRWSPASRFWGAPKVPARRLCSRRQARGEEQEAAQEGVRVASAMPPPKRAHAMRA